MWNIPVDRVLHVQACEARVLERVHWAGRLHARLTDNDLWDTEGIEWGI